MGVKSTRFLTREQAEDLYRSYFRLGVDLSDTELEDELERLNDKANGGRGFDNYQITKSGEYE